MKDKKIIVDDVHDHIHDYLVLMFEKSLDAEISRKNSLENLSGQLIALNTLASGVLALYIDKVLSCQIKAALLLIFLSLITSVISLHRFQYKTFPYPNDILRSTYESYGNYVRKEQTMTSYADYLDKITRSLAIRNTKVVWLLTISISFFLAGIMFVFVPLIFK